MQDTPGGHKNTRFDNLLGYYLLQTRIDEANKANQHNMLIIPANIENITLALPMQKEQGQVTLQRQNTEIFKEIFSEKEYWGLSPNFYIHASVFD